MPALVLFAYAAECLSSCASDAIDRLYGANYNERRHDKNADKSNVHVAIGKAWGTRSFVWRF